MGVKRIPERREDIQTQARNVRRATRTFETNPVAPQALQCGLEEVLALRGHAGDIVLLPLNGRVNVLEDLLDRVRNFLSDTISGDERDLC